MRYPPDNLTSTIKIINIVLAGDIWKPLRVVLLSVTTAILQLIGVAYIVPFLSVTTDPSKFRESSFGHSLNFILPANDGQLVVAVGLVFFLLNAAVGAMTVYGSHYNSRFVWNFLHSLRSIVLTKLMSREIDYFESRDSSSLLKHLEADCVFFSLYLIGPVIDILSKLSVVVALTIGLVYLNSSAVLILLVVLILIYSVLIFIVRQILEPDLSRRNQQFESLYLTISELFNSIKYIMIDRSNNFWLKRFDTVSAEISAIEPKVQLLSIAPRYLLETIGFLMLVIYVSLEAFSEGQLTEKLPFLGFLVLSTYRLLPACQSIYASVNRIINYSYTIELVKASLEDHQKLLADVPATDNFNSSNFNSFSSIEFCNVSFSHVGRRQQLSKANLTINSGTSVAIIGSTGAGKSTLLDLLLGFRFPSSGQVSVNGIELTARNRHYLRKQIGYVGQETTLINSSVLDNIILGEPISLTSKLADVQSACIKAFIHEFIQSELPDQYNTIIGENGRLLSGGERQRIGIARALYRRPKILVLDEATNALDQATEELLMNTLLQSIPELTVIAVTHRSTALSKFNVIYKLESGKCVQLN